jgi:hypothetical protein
MKRSTLPARAFAVHPAFVRMRRISVGICIAIIALMSGLMIYVASDGFAMRREAAIWAHGTPAPDASAEGNATVKVVFVSYKIRVSYRAADGEHTGLQEFPTIAGGANTSMRPSLRYDPDAPAEFATSWGIDASAGRWRWLLIMTGFCLLVITVMARQLRATRRVFEQMRALAARGDEVVATIVSTSVVKLSNGRVTPYIKVEWRAGDHGPFTTQLDTRKGQVAWLPGGGAIGLVAEDGKSGVLLRDDLYPLVASEPEVHAAMELRQRLVTRVT